MDADLKIARAKTQLVLKHPFFGSCAMGLNFTETTALPTMATDGKSILWNREFVDKYDQDMVMGVIAHEVLHVVFKHCLRIGDRDHKKWNVCTDIAINDILKGDGFSLPADGMYHDSKPEWVQYKDWAAERIYSHMPDDQTPDDAPSWGGVIQTMGDDGEPLSDAEASQIEAELDIKTLMAADAAKAQGKLPAKIDQLVQVMRRCQIDWRDVLNRFIGGDQPDDYTWRRPQKNAWFNQGVYLPSVDKVGAGDVIIYVDTSGSVSGDELSHFLGEMNAITEDQKPRSVTVITCDVKVRTVHRYEQGEVIEKIEINGRGGTRVTPVFDYIEDHQLPCDNFVGLTDLEIHDFPNTPDFPVLWVSTDIGSDTAPWGEVAILKMGE